MQTPHEPSLRSVFDEVRLLCQDNDDSVAVVAAVDKLLSAEGASGGETDARGGAGGMSLSKSIAVFVRNVGMQHLSVRNVLLVHLLRLPDPLPFIEVVPSLFSVAVAPPVVQEVAARLQLLLQQDPTLLLPVIGALVELPLPRKLAPQLARLAEVAMAMADEVDLPMLVRTLLKSLALLPEKRVVQSIRREVRGLSEGALALVVDAMWEALPVSERAGSAFLDALAAEAGPGLGLSAGPVLADVAVVLILSSDVGVLRSRARALLSAWLQMQVFPFSHLQRILTLRRGNEVWARMVPGVWRACLWLLAALAATDAPASVGAPRAAYSAAQLGLQRLVLCLYDSVPSMQEAVLSALLGRCYANSAAAQVAPPPGSGSASLAQARKRSAMALLPPLGKGAQYDGLPRDCLGRALAAASTKRAKASGGATQARHVILGLSKEAQQEQRQAVLAASVLSAVVAAHAEAGAAVLVSLTHRLQPEPDGQVLLPVPAVLCPLLACVAASSAASPQTESTLLITVQKLVASASSPYSELAALLGAAPPAVWSAPHSRTHNARAPAPGQYIYTQRTVGLLLAGYFLRRSVRGRVQAPLSQDRHAVLQWVAQAFGGMQDDCLVHALDLFSCCIFDLQTKGNGSAYGGGVEAEAMRVRQLVDGCLERMKRTFQLCFCLQGGAVPEHALSGGGQLERCFVPIPASFPVLQSGKAGVVKEGTVVWSLARLAGALSAVDCEPHLVSKLVSAAFWSLQRAASILAPGTEALLVLSTHARADLSPDKLVQPAQLEEALPAAPAARLWTWPKAAGDADAFVASFKRFTDVAAAVAMQLAWERALAAAVLLGQSQGMDINGAGVSIAPAFALQVTARLLAQLHISRCMLRWASESAVIVSVRGARKSRLPNQRASAQVQRSSAIGVAQRKALHRLLDRCTALLRLPLLLDSLQELLHGTQTLPPKLLTSAGAAIVGAFCLRLLTELPEVQAEHMPSLPSPPPPSSSSSSSSSSSDVAAGKRAAAAHIPALLVAADPHILLDEVSPCCEDALVAKKHALVGKLLSLLPALSLLAEQQRTQVLHGEVAAPDALLGPTLDKRGSSVLLLMVLLLLETHVQTAQAACAGDVIEFAADPLLNSVAVALHPAEPVREIKDVQELDETVGAQRMALLYAALETAVRPLQDCTLAAAGLRALAIMTRGTRLTLRVSRLAWELLGALYTTHTDVSPGLLRSEGVSGPAVAARVLGLDAMWPHIAGHTRGQPFGKYALAEIAPFGRVGRAAGALVCWAFAPATSSGVAGSPASLALRQIAATWWVHEAPPRRLGGMSCLLFQTLGGMFSPMQPPESYSFPGLSEVSAEQHAATALALLPALLLLARPAESSSEPYAALVGASKLFVWALRELQAIASEGDPTGLHERLLPLTVRVCRAELEAAEAAAVHAAHWRSTQPRRASATAVDSGAASHLRKALQWTYAVSQWVLRHAHGIQARSLAAKSGSRGARGARGLVRSVPQLSLLGERVASRMHRLARTHGLDSLEEPDVLSTSVWEDALRDAERSFRQQHDSVLQAGPTAGADGGWQALDARDRDAPAMALAASLEANAALEEDEEEEDGDEKSLLAESSDGFAFFSTGGFGGEEQKEGGGGGSGGWGLYDDDHEHEERGRVRPASDSLAPGDDSEDGEEKDIDEEVEENEEEGRWRGSGSGSGSTKRRFAEHSERSVRPRGTSRHNK